MAIAYAIGAFALGGIASLWLASGRALVHFLRTGEEPEIYG
jgi:hypothetical protein